MRNPIDSPCVKLEKGSILPFRAKKVEPGRKNPEKIQNFFIICSYFFHRVIAAEIVMLCL